MSYLDSLIESWKKLAGSSASKRYAKVCAQLEEFGYHVMLCGNAALLRNSKAQIVAINYLNC